MGTAAPRTVGKWRIGEAVLVLISLHLLVVHRAVGSAEIDGAFGDLLDARAGANGLIVDLGVTVSLVVFVEPFRIDGIGESSARAVNQQISLRVKRKSTGERDDQKSRKLSKHSIYLHQCTWVQLS